MRYIVHIGLHKTGTTALQRTLSEKKSQLIEYGMTILKKTQIPSGNGLGHLILRDGVLMISMQLNRRSTLLKKLQNF